MKTTMKVASKTHHHDDANGNPVVQVELRAVDGLGNLFLYMPGADSDAFQLGSKRDVTIAEVA